MEEEEVGVPSWVLRYEGFSAVLGPDQDWEWDHHQYWAVSRRVVMSKGDCLERENNNGIHIMLWYSHSVH